MSASESVKCFPQLSADFLSSADSGARVACGIVAAIRRRKIVAVSCANTAIETTPAAVSGALVTPSLHGGAPQRIPPAGARWSASSSTSWSNRIGTSLTSRGSVVSGPGLRPALVAGAPLAPRYCESNLDTCAAPGYAPEP